MSWTIYFAAYLLCVSVFWLLPWVEPVSPKSFFACAAFALVICFLGVRKSWRKLPAYSLFCLGFPFISYVSLNFFEYLFSNFHDLGFLGGPLALLFRIFGQQASYQGGFLFLSDEGTSFKISVAAEKLGLIHAGALFTSFVLASFFLRTRVLRVCLFSLLTFLYVCLRFVLLIFAHLFSSGYSWRLEHFSLFWSVPFVALTFLPIFALARISLRWAALDSSGPRWPALLKVATLFALTAFFLQIALWLELPGERKPGNVLIDDHYSGVWEPSTKPYTTDEYGRETVYNMTLGRKYLEHYYSVKINEKEIRREDLIDTDVLVLKTPIYRFDEQSIDAIEDFVRAGGGLVMIGDHTDLMGMTSHLNEIARRFGMEFHADATYDVTTGHDNQTTFLELFRPPGARKLSDVRLLTTCTMEVNPFLVRPEAWIRTSIADEADYSRPSFFGEMEADLADDFGSFVIGGSRRIGAGQVVTIADSTIFSNFAIFMSSRDQLLRSLVELVNRKPDSRERYLRLAALLVFLLLALASGYLARKHSGPVAFLIASLAVFGGLWAGVFAVDRVGRNIAAVEPTSALPRIYFLKDGTEYRMPDPMAHYHGDDEDAYDTVLVNISRTGWMPQEIDNFKDDLPIAAPIVLIRPNRNVFTQQFLGWVNRGGKVLIFAGKEQTNEELPADILRTSRTLPAPAAGIELRATNYGQGRIVILSPAESFSRDGIGDVMEEPAAEAKVRLETMYKAVKALNER